MPSRTKVSFCSVLVCVWFCPRHVWFPWGLLTWIFNCYFTIDGYCMIFGMWVYSCLCLFGQKQLAFDHCREAKGQAAASHANAAVGPCAGARTAQPHRVAAACSAKLQANVGSEALDGDCKGPCVLLLSVYCCLPCLTVPRSGPVVGAPVLTTRRRGADPRLAAVDALLKIEQVSAVSVVVALSTRAVLCLYPRVLPTNEC